MRSEFRVKSIPSIAYVIVASVCSLLLTYLTIAPPLIPTDWARLDRAGVYVPMRLDYAWPSYGLQVGLWLVMVGALIAVSHQLSAVSKIQGQDIHHSGTEDTETKRKKNISVIWILLGITLVGFGLRLYKLDTLPLIIDEIGFAAHASDILHGQHVPIFAPGHNANPSVYSWLIGGAMALFGQNTFAIRLLPLIFGTLCIPAIYVMGREWWSRRVGLLAAAFLATYPAHIFYSRMSLYNSVDPFFAMLALAFLARAVRSPSQRKYWIWAGLMVGIAQYFYHGSRLVLVLMAVYIGLSAINHQLSAKDKIFTTETQRSQRKFPKQNWKITANLAFWRFDILWMIFTFAVVALPRFAPMLVNRLPLTGNEQALYLPADLSANSLRALLAWVGQKDVSPFWLSDAPLLEWPALLAFGIGLMLSLWRWRDPRYGVLILSIVLMTIFGGAIWMAAPLYVRYITAVPAIALLAAIGLSAISGQQSAQDRIFTTEAQRIQRKNAKTPYKMFLQVVVMLLIAAQGVYAAVRQPDEALARINESQWIEQDLAKQAAELPPGTAAVLIVTANFNEVQRITIAHYVAAYGERRVVIINQADNAVSAEQLSRLNQLPYTILRPR